MPAKTTKTTKSKSNVARATGKSSLLNKKIKFNWKIAAVIGVILIAALGYLFVRLSKAGGYTWLPGQFHNHNGRLVVKSDGRQAVESLINSMSSNQQGLYISVSSSVPESDTYCFIGKASKEMTYVIDTEYWSAADPGRKSGGSASPASSRVPAGDFRACKTISGRPSGAYPGKTRDIYFSGTSSAVFAVYSVERKGTTAPVPATGK